MGRARTMRTELLRVRLTQHEDQKLRGFAERKESTVSKIIQEYIRRLPKGQLVGSRLDELEDEPEFWDEFEEF